METKGDTAVMKQNIHLGSKRKRRSSWPLSRESICFSEARSQMPQAVASGAVNQMEKDIERMNIKDPVDGSSASHTLNERRPAEPTPTNHHPAQGYPLQTSEGYNKAPYRGLLNQGATCYLNATLQVLFMTQAFREGVLRAPGDTSERLESALKELFEELSKPAGGAPSVSTTGVIQALGIERVWEQQDAVEYFLDILEKVGLNLAEVFRGTMRNLRRCSENHESHDDSDFKSIQIALYSRDGLCRLEDGVGSYFASTKLVGDDQMYCEDCDEKRDTTWSCELHEYPAVLALHLKRFVYDYWSGRFVKNNCPMDIPLLLPLGEQEYLLYAVVNHRGSRYGGHYTADIRPPGGDKWYCFDDSRVKQTDESKLKGSSEAYLLLYQKMDSPPDSERRKDTQFSHTDLTDPRSGQLLPVLSEPEKSTAPPSSVDRVEDVKEEPKTESAEAGEAEQCGRAHNKPQLGVSAVTGRLRILVLGRPETDKNTLAQMIASEVGFSSKSQLQHARTIKDCLDMCSPGPHMVLWVAPLQKNKEDIKAFKKINRLLGRTARNYMMIVFTIKGHATENIKNATQKYAGIKNNHVLDVSAHLRVQVKELVSKLIKTVDQNKTRNMPYYDKKPWKIKHKKTKNMKTREIILH